MDTKARCERCSRELEVLRQPLRRLRWTRYWWKGFVSLFTRPLRVCPQCGAMYSGEGALLAAGAVETSVEQRLNVYRWDMAYLRDSFGAVVVAAELVVVWLLVGADSVDIAKLVLAGSVGGASFIPFAYFSRKAHLARQDLKRLRDARRKGHFPRETG